MEKYINDIAKLIYDYYKHNKQIDNAFIYKLLDIIISSHNFNGYLRDIKIDNSKIPITDSIEPSTYTFRTRILRFYLASYIDFLYTKLKTLPFTYEEKALYIYNRVTRVILHEIEHIKQHQKIDSSEEDIEKKILISSSIALLVSSKEEFYDRLINEGYTEQEIYKYVTETEKRYRENWTYAPMERIAEVRSHTIMAEVFKILSSSGLSYYECLMLCEKYIEGYEQGLVPTKFYLEQIGADNIWPEIKEEGEPLDYLSRLTFGLPITEREYNYLYNTVSSLRTPIKR